MVGEILLKWTADTDVSTARPRIFLAPEEFQIASSEPQSAQIILHSEIVSVCPLWPSQRGDKPPIFRNAGVFQVPPAAILEWLKASFKSIDHSASVTF